MRLLLDTNILVAGLLSSRRVLGYKHLKPRITEVQAQDFVGNLDALAIMATDLAALEVSPDPDDNVILATAVAGDADAVVSGDRADILVLGDVEGIPIITAREAASRLGLDEE